MNNQEMTNQEMTNQEAINRLEWVKKRICDITYSPESFEAINLAIKALEIVDKLNNAVYRDEDCPIKRTCYDYQGYHCTKCIFSPKRQKEQEEVKNE